MSEMLSELYQFQLLIRQSQALQSCQSAHCKISFWPVLFEIFWPTVSSSNNNNIHTYFNFTNFRCVNEDGRPVPKSAIKYGRPKCRSSEHERKRNRRGKYKKQKNQNPKSEKKQRRNNICVQADRSEFNKNVANLIISDYRDQHGREV